MSQSVPSVMSNKDMLSTVNPTITSFYKENNTIDFEEANMLLINILNLCNDFKTKSNHNTMNNNNKVPENLTKGLQGENDMEIILNQINPTGNIMRNSSTSHFYDFMLMRENKQKLLIESKDIPINVKSEQVELFVNSCQQLKCNGIFISQNSGIINKYNYQIDIVGTNIIVYVHSAEYNIEKIKAAFDIIDGVYDKLRYMNMTNEVAISKEVLNDINQEYQFFIKQKDELKNYIKDNQTKLLNQLDDVKFSQLNRYLSSKFLSNEKVGIHKCNLCNFYTSNTLKGMAAHKRGCKKKVTQGNKEGV